MTPIHYFVFTDNTRIKKDATSFSLASPRDRADSVFTTFATHLIKTSSKKAAALGLRLEQALLELDSHIERLLNNAKELGLRNNSIPEHRAAWIKKTVLEEIKIYCEEHKYFEKRIKTRLILNKSELQITVEPLIDNWQSDAIISCISAQLERLNPELKTTNISVSLRARELAKEKNAEEALLVDKQGFVTEGSYSNLFWFEKQGTLHTPKNDVLPGITRKIVCKIMPCKEKDILLADLIKGADEVFITQSTSGITAVLKIDGVIVGEGKHEKTLALKNKYQDYLNAHCRPIFADETN